MENRVKVTGFSFSNDLVSNISLELNSNQKALKCNEKSNYLKLEIS